MKNVKKLTDLQGSDAMQYLGYNLLSNIEPEITNLTDEPIRYKGWTHKYCDTAYRLVTLPYTGEEDEHIDIFCGKFTMTYDLGKSFDIDGMFTSGFWFGNSGVYMLGEYELYISETKEDLYSESNLVVKVDNADISIPGTPRLSEAYFECEGISGRYFGFKMLKANSRDNITRLGNLGVYNKVVSEQHAFLENIIENNLLSTDDITLPADAKGDTNSLVNGFVFDKEDSVKLSGEIVLENKIEAEKLIVAGLFESATVYTADSLDALFSSPAAGDMEFCDTGAHEETCTLFHFKDAKKYIGIKVSDNATIEQLGLYTYTRKAHADLDNIRTKDFLGIGANDLPMAWMPESRLEGFRNVHWPVYRERMIKARPAAVRVWFQVDWVVTEEEDYLQGICNFKSDKMRAFLKYMDVYEEAGIEVELNFGWKVSTEIQEWFSIPSTGPSRAGGMGKAASAPKNFDGFAKCCAATIKFLAEEKGYTCLKHLTFYNESGYGDCGEYNVSDFAGYCGKSKEMWEHMLRLVDKELKLIGADKYVDYWVSEISGSNETEFSWIEYMMEHCPEFVAVNTFHRYRLKYDIRNEFYKDILALSGEPRALVSEFAVYTDPLWDQSNIDSCMSMLHSGLRGGLYWILQAVKLTDPTWFYLGRGDAPRFFFWKSPYEENAWTECYPFYELSLFNRYLPCHSNVIETKIYNDDIRIEVIETPDGEYTVFVESKKSKFPKNIEVNFSKAIGKKFQKHVYKESNVKLDGNMTVPPVVGEFEVGDKLVDSLDTDYQFVCYTTIPALKQISLNSRKVTLALGETFNFEATTIDCEGEIAWEIEKADGVPGHIDENGLFQQDALTRVGDIQCVKAYLKNDPSVFAIAMVNIK